MQSRQFGKFALLEHMGKGGMGSVYRACDNETGRIVAVKVFESGEDRAPQTSRSLRDREVRMLVSAAHPNIVKFFEAGQVGDDYYYTMEFVEQSLYKWMRSGRDLPLVDKVHILRQAASGLAALHHQGVVHRDVKPGNLLLDLDPSGAIHVKLTDLGIAKEVSEADIVQQQTHRRVLGTPKYVSPEQIRRGPFDGRSDVFGLGVVAYELLGGSMPFRADDSQGYLAANIGQRQRPLRELDDGIPPFLDQIVEKMLAKKREQRYDAETLARDLELAQQHLVSRAPLVEQTNPGSLFYEPQPEGEAAKEGRRPLIARITWELALGIATIGAIVVGLLWPAAPAPGAPAGGSPAVQVDPLEQAQSAADEGRYWQAFALLWEIPEESAPPERLPALRELTRTVQQELAESSHRSATRMLEQDRREEAEILLRQMEEIFPDAAWTSRLADELQPKPTVPPEEEQWQKQLLGIPDLAKRGLYGQALASGREALADCADDREKAASVRVAIGKALDLWGQDLLRSDPEDDAIEEFFSVMDEHAEVATGGPSAALFGQLRIKLAEGYRAAGAYDHALEQYALAAEQGDAQTAQRAESAADDLRASVVKRPLDAAGVAAEFRKQGFLSTIWAKAPGQRVVDGVLRLRVPAEGEKMLAWETIRPIRSLGFTAGVELKVSESMLEAPGTARAGIAVADTEGRVFELAFDGASYRKTVRSGRMSIAAKLRDAVGDEGREWHALGLRYLFDTAQLAVIVDGREVRRYSFDLGDARVRVFLESSAGAPAAAEFRNVFYQPSGAAGGGS